jgi:hypothetical protein
MTYSLRSSMVSDTPGSPSSGIGTVHELTGGSTRFPLGSEEVAATASYASAETLGCAPKSPLTPEISKAAQKVAKACSDVSFDYDGTGDTYYGVPQSGLMSLTKDGLNKETMSTAMSLLGTISKSCQDKEVPELLLDFEDAYGKSSSSTFQCGTQTFTIHARRVIYRSIVCFQGYYDRHHHEIGTLDCRSTAMQGRCRSHVFWVNELYSKRPDDWSALEYLKHQLSKLPELLDRLMLKIAESGSVIRQQLTGTSRFVEPAGGFSIPLASTESLGLRSGKRSKRSHAPEPVESTAERQDSLVIQLKIKGWNNSCDISQRQVLHRLALDGVTKDANPDKGEDESENDDVEGVTGNDDVDALLEGLLCNRYIAQLPAHHRRYLLNELQRALKSRSENPYFHLAMVLGYFDWSRENSSEELTSLDDAELHDQLWVRGMALLSPAQNESARRERSRQVNHQL